MRRGIPDEIEKAMVERDRLLVIAQDREAEYKDAVHAYLGQCRVIEGLWIARHIQLKKFIEGRRRTREESLPG